MSENAKKLAAFVTSTKFDDLPTDIIHEAKRVLLDSLGCGIAALSTDAGKIVVEFANRLGGPKEAAIIGTGDKVACTNAAFANGQLINVMDFDAIPHHTPALIAGELALIETSQASGKDLILSIAIGHEVATRLNSAVRPAMGAPGQSSGGARADIPEILGWSHVIIGVAASAATLLNLSQDELNNALGIASFICPPNTSRRFWHASTVKMAKYTVFGQLAQSGVSAALLAKMGFTGDTDALDGVNSFFKLIGYDQWDSDRITEGLGTEWSGGISYKRYPANFATVAIKESFIQVIEENGIQPKEIQKITLKLGGAAAHQNNTLVVGSNKLETEEDCSFNVPYQIACAAYRINPTRWLDTEVRTDPRLRDMMTKVEFDTGDNEAEVMARGTTFKSQNSDSKGQTGLGGGIMTDEELIDKFKDNVSKVLSPDRTSHVVKAVFELEKLDKATDLMETVSP